MSEEMMKRVVTDRFSCFLRYLSGSISFCFLLLVVVGCHYRGEAVVSDSEKNPVFDRIAVVPFQQIAPEDREGGAVRCPLCGITINAVGTPGNPEKILETLFLEELNKNKPKFHLLDRERVAAVFRRVSANSLKSPLNQVLRDVGGELGAEGVVVGYVYRFRERKGVAYSVEHPAAVTFEIHLLRVSDGALVWRGFFDKTQSSLMEDLFQISSFFRGEGRWVTAKELMGEGLEATLKTFPGLR
ncbi:MAG TPA: hypothetical protein DCZ97_01840 [Syntrophus sp. (in: bacteria)]|nr:MAG: hypothetical protein A2X92_03465 [Syntrophus sp. GWC2_56_31]HBB15781.1 hypothetical protein [Syntrophus sp. (in: bacteria)]